MAISRRARWKGTIAVVVGLPGTFVFLPLTLVGIIGGIAELSTEKFSEPLLLLAWAAAGLTGLCGFWVWTALGPHSGRKVRTAVATSVLVGTCAVAPLAFVFVYSYLVSSTAAVGLVIGCAIFIWLVLPKSPLNPDAPQ